MASSSSRIGRVLEDGASDGKALLLPTGQHHAAFADDRAIAQRQVDDKVMHQRCASGGLDFGIVGLGFAEADILGHRAGKDGRLLLDIGEALAQIARPHVANIDAIDPNRAPAPTS